MSNGLCSTCKQKLICEIASPSVVKKGFGRCRNCENVRRRLPGGRKYCKSLNSQYCRKYKLRVKYGITEEIFEASLREQRGLCAICEEPMVSPFIDHDHNTNRYRALLCNHCNRLLGFARENERILANAIKYLQKYRLE